MRDPRVGLERVGSSQRQRKRRRIRKLIAAITALGSGLGVNLGTAWATEEEAPRAKPAIDSSSQKPGGTPGVVQGKMSTDEGQMKSGTRLQADQLKGEVDKLGPQPEPLQVIEQPLGREAHLPDAAAVGADAGNRQELAQLLLEALPVLFQVALDPLHTRPRFARRRRPGVSPRRD